VSTPELPQLRQVRAGPRTIAYREAGRGSVLVLLHGIGSGSASWRAQYQELGRRFRVIAWDAPGYGGSDGFPGEAPAPKDYATSVLDLADALEMKHFDLLGHSLGGVVAASFARHYPDRLNRLILANPSPGYAAAPEAVRRARVDARIHDMKTLGPEGLAAKRSPGLLSANASREMLDAVAAVQRQLRPEAYAQAARMLGLADTIADGSHIKAPTLVIGSSNDTMTPEDVCKKIAASIPGARYAGLTGPGHASYIEDAAGFDKLVLSFLS